MGSANSEKILVESIRYYKDTVTYDRCHNSLPDNGGICGRKLAYAHNLVYNGKNVGDGLVCPRCRILYRKVKPQVHPEKREVSFCTKDVVLYVGKSPSACKSKGHPLEAVTGIFQTLHSGYVKINVNYCKRENIYFMTTEDYRSYRDAYGAVLGNIRLNILKAPGTYHDFSENAEYSPLRLYGYNVDQSIGLSDGERRRILGNILDYGLMYKSDIIGYLDYFLRINRRKDNRELACSKWESDRQWVRDYQIDQQRHVHITGTKRYPSHR